MADRIIPGLVQDASTVSAATPYQVVQGKKDETEATLNKQEGAVGIVESTYDSFRSGGNSAVQLYYDLDRMQKSGPVDPNWRSAGGNEKWLKANSALVPADQAWRYMQTKNATEAQLMLNDANFNQGLQTKLARRFNLNPVSTFAAMAISGLVDVDAPVSLMTGGISASAKIGLTATKVGRVLAGAAGGAVAGLAVGSAGYASNPVEDWTSIPVAGIGGMAFGLIGGAISGGHPEVRANDARVKVLNEFGDATADGNVRAKEDIRAEPQLHTDPYRAQALREAEAADADILVAPEVESPRAARAAALDEVVEDAIPEDLPIEGRATVGARQLSSTGPGVASIRSTMTQDIIQNARKRDQQIGVSKEWFANSSKLDAVSAPLGKAARVFHDAVVASPLATDFAKFMRSGSVTAQMLAYDHLENASGIIRNNRSGAMLMDHYQKSMLADFMPYHDHFDEWAGRVHGAGIWQKVTDNKMREDFNVQLIGELNNRNYGTAAGRKVDPAIAKAADAIDKTFAKEIEVNVGRPGEGTTKGYETLVPKSGYFPQKWLGGKMQKLINSGRYGAGAAGQKAISKAIAESYLVMHPRLSPKDAQIWAEAVVERSLRANEGISMNLVGILKDADGRKAMEDLLIRNGADKHSVDRLIDKLTGTKEEAGRAGHTKNRMDADLNFVASNGIKLMDLVDTDVNKIVAMRARKAAGSAAMARKGIYSRADIDAVKEAILQEQIANGPSIKTGNVVEDALSSDKNLTAQDIDEMFSYFEGKPIAGGISPMYSRIRKLTNLSLLNQLGLTQVAEFGPTIAAVGWKKFIRMAGSEIEDSLKKADSPLVQELKHMNVFVPEEKMFRDDLTFEYEKTSGGTSEYMQKFDNFLNKGQRLQGYTSGFYAVRNMQQRLAVTTMATKLGRFFKDGTGMSMDRLRDMGFDADLIAKVQADAHHMQYNADGDLTKLNLDKWDTQTAENFILTMNRSTNQLVQKAMAGESSAIFHRDGLASLFWHLKSFPMLALEKQTLRNARLADGRTNAIFLYGMATAGAAYMAKQAINGKTENLDPVNVMRGAFGLSNMTGWIPMWVDPLAGMLGMDSVDLSGYGSYGATSVLSVPAALSTMDKMAQLPGAVVGLLNPFDTMDNSDIRALQTLPIIGNLYGFTAVFNAWKDSIKKEPTKATKANPLAAEMSPDAFRLTPDLATDLKTKPEPLRGANGIRLIPDGLIPSITN